MGGLGYGCLDLRVWYKLECIFIFFVIYLVYAFLCFRESNRVFFFFCPFVLGVSHGSQGYEPLSGKHEVLYAIDGHWEVRAVGEIAKEACQAFRCGSLVFRESEKLFASLKF